MSAGEDCPLCRENGHQRKLRKFCINFEESIILCSNSKCTYPMGCINLDRLLLAPTGQELAPTGQELAPNSLTPSANGIYSNGNSQLQECQLRQQELIVCPQQNGVCRQRNGLCPQQNEMTLQHNGVCSNPGAKILPLSETNLNGCPEKQILCSKVLDNKLITNPSNIPVNKCPDVKSTFGDKSLRFVTEFPGYDSNSRAHRVSNKLSLSGLQTVFKKTSLCSEKDEAVKGDRPVKCPIDRWFLQWENRDALCWLDVVLCLLVQSQSIRKAIEIKETNLTDLKKGFLVRTLLSAYDQALTLSKSLLFECRRQLQIERNHKSALSEQGIALCSPNIGLPKIHTPGQLVKPVSQVYTMKEDKFGLLNLSHNGKLSSIMSGKKGVPLKMGAGQTDIHLIPTRTSMAELIAQNSNFCKARSILNTVREVTWEELQPKLRCEKGRKDSPVFAIPLLLHSDPDICHLFKTTYKFETSCTQCGNTKIERYTKVLPTLPKVVAEFSMSNICHLRDCFTCKAPNQKRQLHFESLADCVMIHFVEGLPSPDLSLLDFSLDGASFHVSAVIQYKNEPSHFVIWIQHSSGDSWMECDDLKGPLCKFSQSRPSLPASEIHIVFWERDANTTKQTNQYADSQTTTEVSKEIDTQNHQPLIDNLSVPVDKNCSREVTTTKQITSNICVQNYLPLSSTLVNNEPTMETTIPKSKIVQTEYKPKSSVMKKNYLLLKQMKAKQSGDKSINNFSCVANNGKVGSSSSSVAIALRPSILSNTRMNKEGSESKPIKQKPHILVPKFEAYRSKKDTSVSEKRNFINLSTSLRPPLPTTTTPQYTSSTKGTSSMQSTPTDQATLTSSSVECSSSVAGKRRKSSSSGSRRKRLNNTTGEFSTSAQGKDKGGNPHSPLCTQLTASSVVNGTENSNTLNEKMYKSQIPCSNVISVPSVITGVDNSSYTIRGDNYPEPTDLSTLSLATRTDNSADSLLTDVDLTDLGFCNLGTGLIEDDLDAFLGSMSASPGLDETGDASLSEADILQDLYKALDITAPESMDVHLTEDIFS